MSSTRAAVIRSLSISDLATGGTVPLRKWLNLDQLTQIVPLKKSRIYYLTHTGQIPFTKIGRTLLFDYDRIMQWLEDGGNVGSTDHRVSHSTEKRQVVRQV